MLSADDPRIEPLREQAAAARVIGTCPCGCATIYLEVDPAKARVATGLAHDAVNSHSCEHADLERVRELILFVKDGWLSSLEVVYYGASPPRLLPDPTEMESPWVPP